MFGKARQVKKLETQLLATKTMFGLYDRLPPERQALALQNSPANLAEAVHDAVKAGHGAAAREIVEAARVSAPSGVSPELWAQVMAPAVTAAA